MTAPTPNFQCVIGDKGVIGFLLSCVRGWKSYDADGLPSGIYPTEAEAARAVYEQATKVKKRR